MRRLAMINSDGKSRPVTDDPEELSTDLVELRVRAFARTPARRLLTDLATFDAAERALAAGAHGVYVDSFADYAVDALRAATDRPVVGAGEAALRRGVERHDSFAVLTVWPESLRFLYDDRIAAVPGAARACRAVEHFSNEDELDLVGSGASVRARMVRGEDALLPALIGSCRDLVARTGVAAVVLGCTCMAPVADALAAACDVPVLDPARIGLEEARRAVLAAPDTADAHHPDARMADVVAAWAAAELPEASDDCVVCALPTVT